MPKKWENQEIALLLQTIREISGKLCLWFFSKGISSYAEKLAKKKTNSANNEPIKSFRHEF